MVGREGFEPSTYCVGASPKLTPAPHPGLTLLRSLQSVLQYRFAGSLAGWVKGSRQVGQEAGGGNTQRKEQPVVVQKTDSLIRQLFGDAPRSVTFAAQISMIIDILHAHPPAAHLQRNR